MQSQISINSNQSLFLGSLILILIACQSPTHADDGVLEINQACVVTGCFPGDDPGFPVSIDDSGAYILTSNLDLTGEAEPHNTTAIFVESAAAYGVVIDLNGFVIFGSTSCTGTPVTSCEPLGTGTGVSGNANKVTVRNGTIQGMGDAGVALMPRSEVENVTVLFSGGNGIQASSEAHIRNNNSSRNGGHGFAVGQTSLVIANIARANAGFGLSTNNFTGYGTNNFRQNGDGEVDGGLQVAPNVCNLDLCP